MVIYEIPLSYIGPCPNVARFLICVVIMQESLRSPSSDLPTFETNIGTRASPLPHQLYGMSVSSAGNTEGPDCCVIVHQTVSPWFQTNCFEQFRSSHVFVSSGRETKSRWSLLPGVYARGNNISHAGKWKIICRGL